MKDRQRLHEIDQILDAGVGDVGYVGRNTRRALNRERKKIINRLHGRDAYYFATGRTEGSRGLVESEGLHWRVKAAINKLLEILER
jgi:hypothetical protein